MNRIIIFQSITIAMALAALVAVAHHDERLDALVVEPVSNSLSLKEIADPGVSTAGFTRLYMDSTSHTLKASQNGNAYADLGGVGSTWTIVNKTATDTITNDATDSLDDELFFAATNGVTYRIRGALHFTSTTNADAEVRIVGPTATIAAITYLYRDLDNADASTVFTSSDTNLLTIDFTSGVQQTVLFEGLFQAGSTDTLGVFWAQRTSSADSTSLNKGSYIEYDPL